jgi:hypothetical protein
MGVLAAVLGSCAPSVIDRTLAERPVFVEVPAGGIATPAQKARYDNNPVAIGRIERRCTYKPAAGAVCNSSVELRIKVLEGAKLIKAGGHSFGPQLLALIQNRGSTPTFDGILPGEQALVAVGRPGQTALKLVRFQTMIGSPNFAVSERDYGIVTPCDSLYSGLSSDMSFRGCKPHDWSMRPGNSEQGVLATSLLTVEMRQSFLKGTDGKSDFHMADYASMDDPLWLRCSPGCCTS